MGSADHFIRRGELGAKGRASRVVCPHRSDGPGYPELFSDVFELIFAHSARETGVQDTGG
jgi:hypothetical protein